MIEEEIRAHDWLRRTQSTNPHRIAPLVKLQLDANFILSRKPGELSGTLGIPTWDSHCDRDDLSRVYNVFKGHRKFLIIWPKLILNDGANDERGIR